MDGFVKNLGRGVACCRSRARWVHCQQALSRILGRSPGIGGRIVNMSFTCPPESPSSPQLASKLQVSSCRESSVTGWGQFSMGLH